MRHMIKQDETLSDGYYPDATNHNLETSIVLHKDQKDISQLLNGLMVHKRKNCSYTQEREEYE